MLIIMRLFWRWPRFGQRQRALAAVGLTAAVGLGALLKPNLIVLLPALVIVALWLWRQKHFKAQHWALPILLVVLGFGLSRPASQGLQSLSHYTPNSAEVLPMTNWLRMGLNPQTTGRYSAQDVQQANQAPTPAAKQQQDLTVISQRLNQLGPLGLLRLWLGKLGYLLRVGGIQTWYNGGLRASPSWYQKHAAFFQALTKISYAAATVSLWLVFSWRLVHWRPELNQTTTTAIMLAVVTALGYLAFHTLLWEVSGRYGQVLLPLIMIGLAGIPAPAPVPKAKTARLPVLMSTATAIIWLLSGMIVSHLRPQKIIVAAQRSQLSAQYHAQPEQLQPQTVMQEAVRLNGPADYFSVQVHAQSQVQVVLQNLHTKKAYPLTAAGAVYRLHQHLPAGRYQITLLNASTASQAVDVVTTSAYQLNAFPLVINGDAHKTASLIYTSIDHEFGGGSHG
ncbi:hypothetical protein ACFQ5J_13745 [Lacticaseibacillus baoqingensis]|uniref:DUF2142 domain-containing protein n=2 Tax=Lacticaseibacillus baoqingensis TaxID=2486013 RepID=A0ABW4E8T8_9LACO